MNNNSITLTPSLFEARAIIILFCSVILITTSRFSISDESNPASSSQDSSIESALEEPKIEMQPTESISDDDEEDYIASVQQKTLVVNGKDDQVVPLASAHKFLELIDDSWGYIMPHCGHWAMIEYPEDFSGAVSAFIKSH